MENEIIQFLFCPDVVIPVANNKFDLVRIAYMLKIIEPVFICFARSRCFDIDNLGNAVIDSGQIQGPAGFKADLKSFIAEPDQKTQTCFLR